jgi:predicted acetyltransferase
VTEGPVSLDAARPSDAPVLANLLELYCHDLSEAFALAIGPDGKFGYPRLALYFSEPDRRFPFLVRAGGELAGFALATRGSPLGDAPTDLDVAEFFVLRRHRRAGVGRQAAARLWDRMPGHWIVRVADSNAAALPFWSEVIGACTGQRFTRDTRPLGGRTWTRFAFDAPAAGAA